MKYWQPRREPISKGLTLADVPENVLCEVESKLTSIRLARRHGGTVVEYRNKPSDSDPYYPEKYRVLRVIDPIPPSAMTLDRVPEGVRCVVKLLGCQHVVIKNSEGLVAWLKTDGTPREEWCDGYLDCQVLHILDPLPEVTYTLDTLPVGRVIEWQRHRYFKHGIGEPNGPFSYWNQKGQIVNGVSGPNDGGFTVTDIIMELKDVV
jgi:hypothetical protein